MSADYTTAIQNGSNLVRIGSLIFGERNYTKLTDQVTWRQSFAKVP